MNDLTVKTKERLTLVAEPMLTHKQLAALVANTPKRVIKRRPAKGGGTWEYVTVSYVEQKLNSIFGWLWSFEVKEHGTSPNGAQVWALGKLTILNPETGAPMIIKEQFGRKDIAMKKDGSIMDFGNDLKAAASDALKKCAAKVGIAADIYADDETKELIRERSLQIMAEKKAEEVSGFDKIQAVREELHAN